MRGRSCRYAAADLNPSLLRRTTPKDQAYDLRVPAGSKEMYETAIASIPEDKRVAWRYHKVQAGDSLTAVARKYHTTEKAIAQANNLQGTTLAAETKLVIPISASAAGSGKIVYSRYPSRYKAHTGDTVQSVAEVFRVPADRLRRWNRLKGNELRRGRLVVATYDKPLMSTSYARLAVVEFHGDGAFPVAGRRGPCRMTADRSTNSPMRLRKISPLPKSALPRARRRRSRAIPARCGQGMALA